MDRDSDECQFFKTKIEQTARPKGETSGHTPKKFTSSPHRHSREDFSASPLGPEKQFDSTSMRLGYPLCNFVVYVISWLASFTRNCLNTYANARRAIGLLALDLGHYSFLHEVKSFFRVSLPPDHGLISLTLAWVYKPHHRSRFSHHHFLFPSSSPTPFTSTPPPQLNQPHNVRIRRAPQRSLRRDHPQGQLDPRAHCRCRRLRGHEAARGQQPRYLSLADFFNASEICHPLPPTPSILIRIPCKILTKKHRLMSNVP